MRPLLQRLWLTAIGQVECCSTSYGDGQFYARAPVPLYDVRNDSPVWCLYGTVHLIKVCGVGTYNEMAVARLVLVGTDAGQPADEPGEATSEHGMVMAILAVPLLPGGGGSLFYPPAIAWEIEW